MNPSLPNIEATLLEVRKAYRLLHDYQRLVLDAVDYVGKQLGFTYAGGYPKFSSASPGQGRGKLGCWAWDWLNMILYEFHFTRTGNEGKLWRFSLLLISDTGYFCSKLEDANKCEVDSYLPVDGSATKIGFLMSAREWPDPAFMGDKEGISDSSSVMARCPRNMQLQGLWEAAGVWLDSPRRTKQADWSKRLSSVRAVSAYPFSGWREKYPDIVDRTVLASACRWSKSGLPSP